MRKGVSYGNTETGPDVNGNPAIAPPATDPQRRAARVSAPINIGVRINLIIRINSKAGSYSGIAKNQGEHFHKSFFRIKGESRNENDRHQYGHGTPAW